MNYPNQMGQFTGAISPLLRFLVATLFVVATLPTGGSERVGAATFDRLKLAIDRLTEAPNYSWTQTQEISGDADQSVTKGHAERGGYTVATRQFLGSITRSVRKGQRTVIEKLDGRWETEEEAQAALSKAYGREARKPVYLRTPVDELTRLVPHFTDLAALNGTITARIDEDGIAQAYGDGMVRITRLHLATITFWLTDGQLTKYQLHYHLTIRLRGKEEERNQKVTVTLSNIGTTTVEAPQSAIEKLLFVP